MLDTLITSKTRLKLLLKFFLNSSSSAYLRNLENEFGESTNAIRLELNRFEEANLLNSVFEGNKKMYKANTNHPLFTDIHNLLLKHVGFDQIIDKVATKVGEIKCVFVIGGFARGIDNNIIDLLFVAENINRAYLVNLIEKAENIIKRRIRYLVYNEREFSEYLNRNRKEKMLLLWKNDVH